MPTKNIVTRRLLHALLVVFVGCALLAFGFALAATWREASEQGLPSVPILGVVLAITCGAVIFGAHGWATLVGGPHRRVGITQSYYVSQLAKYLPGGIWQPAGQIAITARAGVPARRATGLLVLYLVLFAAVALPFGLVAGVFGTHLPPLVRIGLIAMVSGIALTRPRPLASATNLIGRRTGRTSEEIALPPRRAIDGCCALLFGHHVAQGVGFAVLLLWFHSGTPWLLAIAVYPLAWLAGIAALPLPSGIGVREAVLVGLLHGAAPPEAVLAASIVLRLANLAAECVLLGANQLHNAATRHHTVT